MYACVRACACVVLVAEMCALKHAHAGKHAGLIQACPRFSPFDVSTRPLTVSANQFSNPRMAKSRCHRVFASSCVTNVAGSRISLPKRVFAFVRSKKVARQINKRLVRERCALWTVIFSQRSTFRCSGFLFSSPPRGPSFPYF